MSCQKNESLVKLLLIALTVVGMTFSQVQLKLLENRANLIQVECDLLDYSTSKIAVGNDEYLAIHLSNGSYSAEKGFPDLPSMNKSLLIPDDRKMKVELLGGEYKDFSIEGIVPSRGVIYRTQDPATVPYVLGDVYQQDTWYPQNNAILGTPFIYRDFRGALMQVYPFQYNPVKKLLRVYSKMILQVTAVGPDNENVFIRPQGISNGLDAEFSQIYQRHFLNFEPSRYPIVPEDGNMLIVSHADFMSTLAPFIEWKKKKGVKLEVVDVATAGTTAAALQTYIKNYYNDAAKKLKYVLLVGDYDKVPTLLVQSKYGSDVKFGEIAGTDCYSEILIGRFSGTTAAHIKTQVDRSVYYETKLKTTDTWLSNVLLTASSDATKNKWGETDADFVNHAYDTLIKAGYTNVFRHNQSGVGGTGCISGNVASVTGVINTGISFWEYSDHGSKTSYPAVGFTNSSVPGLNNPNRLFYTYAIACNPGEFNTGAGDCLGEAFMKAEKSGLPTGTIGCYMGSISQPWDPPYAGCREILYISLERYPANKKYTMGGVMINGGMKCYEDCPNTSGKDVTESFVLLGDPNLQIYTKTPKAISITHPASISSGAQAVTVTGTEGAQVCLYGKQGAQAVGTIKGGTVSIQVDGTTKDSLFVTAMLFNCETYQGLITVGPTSVINGGGAVSYFDMRYSNSRIYYQIPQSAAVNGMLPVSLRLYDLKGTLVSSLVNELKVPGCYSIDLGKTRNTLARGIYISDIRIGTFTKTIRVEIK